MLRSVRQTGDRGRERMVKSEIVFPVIGWYALWLLEIFYKFNIYKNTGGFMYETLY